MACCDGMLVITDDTTSMSYDNIADGMVPDLAIFNSCRSSTANKHNKYVRGSDGLINDLVSLVDDADTLTSCQLSERLSDLHLSSVAITNLLATTTVPIQQSNTCQLITPIGPSDVEEQKRRHFWQLFHRLLEDCEMAPKYDPDCINITNTPVTRRWYVSHYALIQDLLQRHTGLRRMTIILRWLELTYDRKDTYKAKLYRGKYDNISSHTWFLDNENDPHSVKESIFEALRRGECSNAVRAATIGNDGVHACVVECARMQMHDESWFSQTNHVPLFGEYCYTPSTNKAQWTSNEHRIDHLATIFELSNDIKGESCGSTTLERAIYALLSGNSEVLGDIYDTNRWQDRLWVCLRCTLVCVFTRVFADYAPENEVPMSSYYYYLLSKCESVNSEKRSAVLDTLTERALAQVRAELAILLVENTGCSLAEEMQLRLIIHALDTKDTTNEMFECIHDNVTGVITNQTLEGNNAAFLAAVMIACDAAHQEGLMVNGPQNVRLLFDQQYQPQNVGQCDNTVTKSSVTFANYLTKYFCGVVMDSDLPDGEAVKRAVAGLLRIRDSALRGRALAFVVVTARQRYQHRVWDKLEKNGDIETELLRHIRLQDQDKYPGQECMYAALLRAMPEAMETKIYNGESQMLTGIDMSCECLLWECMACTSTEAKCCVDKGLSYIETAWRERHIAKIVAIVGILNRLIFSCPIEEKLATIMGGDWNPPLCPEFRFWSNFTKVTQMSDDHSRAVAVLQTAIHSNGKLAAVRSKHAEVELFNFLEAAVDGALSTSISIKREGSQYCNGAPLYCAELFANACTLSILATAITDENGEYRNERGACDLDRLLIAARRPVGILAGLGLLEEHMVLTTEAHNLFDAYKTVRIAFSRKRLAINNAGLLNHKHTQ